MPWISTGRVIPGAARVLWLASIKDPSHSLGMTRPWLDRAPMSAFARFFL
ncbi:MAG: hypothetical protein OJF58_003751 [Enhydrobacter sp.]|nr:MAG: hypothetical protein OJF58_003751 [Enhydrobacter sp.]